MTQKKERWRQIKEGVMFLPYFASSEGRIKNQYGKILKPHIYRGTPCVCINTPIKCRRLVCILVLEAFKPKGPEKAVVNFHDRNPGNTKLENMYWGYKSMLLGRTNQAKVMVDGNGWDRKIFNSAKDASIALGVDYQAVTRMCRNKLTRNGIKWRYV